jgi:hypothetical protein
VPEDTAVPGDAGVTASDAGSTPDPGFPLVPGFTPMEGDPAYSGVIYDDFPAPVSDFGRRLLSPLRHFPRILKLTPRQ